MEREEGKRRRRVGEKRLVENIFVTISKLFSMCSLKFLAIEEIVRESFSKVHKRLHFNIFFKNQLQKCVYRHTSFSLNNCHKLSRPHPLCTSWLNLDWLQHGLNSLPVLIIGYRVPYYKQLQKVPFLYTSDVGFE